MCFFCDFCYLAVYFGIWWLCLQLLPPTVGCAVDIYQGQFRSLVLHMALVYPCSHPGVGEYKARGLTGLALAWYTAVRLCCAPCTHTHTHIPAWRSTVGQPRCYIALEPDAIYGPVLLLLFYYY